MSFADTIIDKVVEAAISGRSRIAACAAHGSSCEGWLKVEILHRLVGLLSEISEMEILVEAQNIDLTVRTPSEQVLLELKTFPTNYGRGGGKPITNSINGVVNDLVKLSSKRAGGTGLAVWLAYVVPEPVPPTWPAHVKKVQAAASRTRRTERIPLWENAFANLYVVESH